jgi:F-type H+-transporting ATPase subunit a
MFPLHVMGELIKPVSLSLRLFGNILGEDALIAAFLTFGIVALSFIKSPVGTPLQLPFMLLAILTGTVQALVFSLLTTIYLFTMLPHDTHHAHAAGEEEKRKEGI